MCCAFYFRLWRFYPPENCFDGKEDYAWPEKMLPHIILSIFATYFLQKMLKRNVPVLGFILGAVFPLIGSLVVFLVLGRGQQLGDFFNGLFHNHQTLAKVIALSLLANILPFMLYTNRRLDLTARGIFIATMLYFLAFILVKYIW